MRIELGIWDHFERRPDVPVAEQYAEKIALLQEAEALGCRGYHVAEHHLSPLDLVPSPFLFLAALAQATTRLRVGTLVSILPLYHPVRFVQEVCMLDQLAGGRLDLGVGRGARRVEHEWFGLDPEDSRAHYADVLGALVGALTSGTIAGAPLDVLPVQQPYPPLWAAGKADGAAQRNLNLIGRDAETVLEYWRLWEETPADAAGRLNPHVAQPTVGITRHLVVAETDAEALAVAQRAWRSYLEHWSATSIVTTDGVPFPAPATVEEAIARGSVIVGSPATMAEILGEQFAPLHELGEVYFAPAIQWGDISRAEASQTLQLLAGEVLPALGEPVPTAL